jgi:hypothetical protein
MSKRTDTAETEIPTPALIAADTMLGDLMACMIDEFKSAPDVWQKMPMERLATGGRLTPELSRAD